MLERFIGPCIVRVVMKDCCVEGLLKENWKSTYGFQPLTVSQEKGVPWRSRVTSLRIRLPSSRPYERERMSIFRVVYGVEGAVV